MTTGVNCALSSLVTSAQYLLVTSSGWTWLTSYQNVHLHFLTVGLQICAVMADSRFAKLNYNKLNYICCCSDRLHDFLRQHNVLFNFSGQYEQCCDRRKQLRQEKSLIAGGQLWHCTNRKCSAKNSIRKYSFFSRSHLPLATITKLVYYWTYKYPQEIILHELGLSTKTVVNFYNFCREVCKVVLEEQSEPIGGPGKVVEIDESKFGKRKYHSGKS